MLYIICRSSVLWIYFYTLYITAYHNYTQVTDRYNVTTNRQKTLPFQYLLYEWNPKVSFLQNGWKIWCPHRGVMILSMPEVRAVRARHELKGGSTSLLFKTSQVSIPQRNTCPSLDGRGTFVNGQLTYHIQRRICCPKEMTLRILNEYRMNNQYQY